ncbi:hypothetical protein BVC80_379g131 [Macleaya cordata]|uniref:Retrotransposon Copia-like N-terminal domain-containing protein n=1 Tax=Macleaya cordata TaxID=56857 RepID=A0A200QT27_MACCD|nr:hypothetical protein BVC80_379g131 [Macleaya cordata]
MSDFIPDNVSPTRIAYATSRLKDHVTVKLERNNFNLWNHQLSNLLRDNGISCFVYGKSSMSVHPLPLQMQMEIPSSTKNSKNGLSWKRLLCHWIKSTLSDAVLAQVGHLQTSAEVWSEIDRHWVARTLGTMAEFGGTTNQDGISRSGRDGQLGTSSKEYGTVQDALEEQHQLIELYNFVDSQAGIDTGIYWGATGLGFSKEHAKDSPTATFSHECFLRGSKAAVDEYVRGKQWLKKPAVVTQPLETVVTQAQALETPGLGTLLDSLRIGLESMQGNLTSMREEVTAKQGTVTNIEGRVNNVEGTVHAMMEVLKVINIFTGNDG